MYLLTLTSLFANSELVTSIFLVFTSLKFQFSPTSNMCRCPSRTDYNIEFTWFREYSNYRVGNLFLGYIKSTSFLWLVFFWCTQIIPVDKKMSTRSHQKCPREFTLRKCPLELANFEKSDHEKPDDQIG